MTPKLIHQMDVNDEGPGGALSVCCITPLPSHSLGSSGGREELFSDTTLKPQITRQHIELADTRAEKLRPATMREREQRSVVSDPLSIPVGEIPSGAD